MRIGILGSGLMGGKLGTIFVRSGLVYCGDDEQAKRVAADLIRDAGFDPVDFGSLRITRYTEPFALLIGEIAYGGTAGPQLAYRFERFAEA